ncbi:hypothetical protein EMGR_008082 [Emarellia grisea]
MAVADYRKYLAENVLNERRTVTYRSLGRALKVHCNLAKRMLYEFHRTENKKKPQSVNATYIITGIQRPSEKATNSIHAESHDDGDDIMQGSPFLPSSMPNQDAASDEVPTTSIILAREEDLDGKCLRLARSNLQPAVLQDLNVLTDVHREMLAAHAHEDPLEYGKQWGMIQNKDVKRRTGVRPPPPAPTPAQEAAAPSKRPSQDEATQKVKSESKKAEHAAMTSQTKAEEKPPVKPSEKTAPLKREKSDLFSSFAKAKSKQKKDGSATPAVSGAESAEPSGAEDVLGDASDEEEPEELFPDSGKSSTANNRETRKEREEKLRKMMEDEDDDDEEMADVPEPPMEEEKTIDQPPTKEEPREEITVSGGRRRGRRKVMKKKTVKDEEGYLGENLRALSYDALNPANLPFSRQ